MPFDPVTAYRRLIDKVRELEGVKLHADEAQALRDAADARLFEEEELEGRMADADVVLLRLELADRLTLDAIADLRRRLLAIQGVGAGTARLAA